MYYRIWMVELAKWAKPQQLGLPITKGHIVIQIWIESNAEEVAEK